MADMVYEDIAKTNKYLIKLVGAQHCFGIYNVVNFGIQGENNLDNRINLRLCDVLVLKRMEPRRQYVGNHTVQKYCSTRRYWHLKKFLSG